MSAPQRPAYTMTRDEALHEASDGALGQLCKRIVAERPDLFAAPLVDSADPARTPDAATDTAPQEAAA